MKRITTLAALAVAFTATPAFAQAEGGPFIGVIGGFEGIDVESGDGSVSADADSAVYGINAGYDLSLGSAFVGIEGEISTSENSTDFPGDFDDAYDGLDTDGQYYLGLRAGFAVTPGIAAYGKVGYTSLDTTAFTQSGSLDDLEENTDGIRFGGGLQVQLPGPLEARLEYRRSRYGGVADDDFDDITTDQVVAGVGLRF
ncbi:outer membrane protein [Aurantiacibacter aquimixticola]|uniref:Porin family protein n=1 Tax=Aurantiacibacter aquimixticola TaxID=1958945 RepID=A0A419RX40_9SPHN|nr:outer membrane beta-barrel protein [Aurantiacibacter aquimixticola]RJY10365.1 porin family protein [Aurantiacibacter aquimixticola]